MLSDDELARVWRAAKNDVYGVIVRLLILTAQRKGEIAGLRWEEIDLDRGIISLPSSRTKNHRPHAIPLSPTARRLLESRPRNGDAVFGNFQGWGFAKKRLDQRAGISVPWVLHDLRRSVASGMGDLGVQPDVIESVLNHQSGSKAGISGVYNRSPYAAEKAAALELWDKHVAQIVGGVLVVKIDDVRDRRVCEKALGDVFRALREHHSNEVLSRFVMNAMLGESDDEAQALQKFDAACQRFFPFEDLRLVLEYCAMDRPSKQGLAKILARRNEDLPDAPKYVRGSTSETTMLQQIKRVLKKGSAEDIATIAAGSPELRAEYLRHTEYVSKINADARAAGVKRRRHR